MHPGLSQRHRRPPLRLGGSTQIFKYRDEILSTVSRFEAKLILEGWLNRAKGRGYVAVNHEAQVGVGRMRLWTRYTFPNSESSRPPP